MSEPQLTPPPLRILGSDPAIRRATQGLPDWRIEDPRPGHDGAWIASAEFAGPGHARLSASGSTADEALVSLAGQLSGVGWPWRRRTRLAAVGAFAALLVEMVIVLTITPGSGWLFLPALVGVGFVPVLLAGGRGALIGIAALGIEMAAMMIVGANAGACVRPACINDESLAPLLRDALVVVAGLCAGAGGLAAVVIRAMAWRPRLPGP